MYGADSAVWLHLHIIIRIQLQLQQVSHPCCLPSLAVDWGQPHPSPPDPARGAAGPQTANGVTMAPGTDAKSRAVGGLVG